MSNYSEKERQLLEHYDLDYLAEDFGANAVYNMMATKAFIWNEKNKYSDSLRSCLVALDSGIFRKTPEFEALIQLECGEDR